MAGGPPLFPGPPPPPPPPPPLSSSPVFDPPFPPVWPPPSGPLWPPPSWPVWPSPPPPSSPDGQIVLILVVVFVAFLVVLTCVGYRNRRARDSSAAAAAAAGRPPAPLPRVMREDAWREFRRMPCTRAASPQPTPRLPAFSYSHRLSESRRSVEEEAPPSASASTCSVCLAAFRLGETVRLLPACLHLYHAECIDPWLDAHSTCPICRSDADPSTDAAAARRPLPV